MSAGILADLAPRIVAITAVIAFGLPGCNRAAFSERTAAPLSGVHDTRSVIRGTLALEQMHVTAIALPFPVTKEGVILAGNVHRRPGSEFVVVDRGGIAIVGTDGDLITIVNPTEPVLRAGVLTDIDGDRLADIVTGVTGRADPIIRIFNGLGKEIATRRVEIAGRIAGSVHPAALVENGILVLAGESSPDSPRGVVRLNLPGLSHAWFAAVPTGVGGVQLVNGDAMIAVSNHTQHHGEFNEFGIHQDTRTGFDSRPRVVFMNSDGAILAESPAGARDDSIDQRIWFLPHDDETVLGHLVENRETLVLIDASTAALARPTIVVEKVHQILTTPHDDQVGCVYTFSQDGGWEVRISDSNLATLARWTGVHDPPRVLAIVRQSSNLTLLAVHGGEVVLMDDAGISPTGHRTSITHGVTVVENETAVLIAGLGDGMEVIEVRVDRLTP